MPLVLRPIDDRADLDATSPYGYPGPLVDPSAEPAFLERACQAFARSLAGRGLVTAFVRMHPFLSPELSESLSRGRTVRHGQTVSIDLGLEEDQMWEGIRSGHRAEIRRTREAGVEVTLDATWSRLDAFAQLYEETMMRVNAAPEYFFSPGYFSALRDLDGARTYLASALLAGEAVAMAIFLETSGIVQYHLSASRRLEPRLQPTKLLIDDVRSWASAAGHRILHLGGGLGGGEDGLFQFKAGFSGLRHDFHTWRLVLDQTRYESICSAAGVDAGDPFFPAYRKPG